MWVILRAQSTVSSAIRSEIKTVLLAVPVCEEEKWKWPDSYPFSAPISEGGALKVQSTRKQPRGMLPSSINLASNSNHPVSSPPLHKYLPKSPTQNSTWQPITLLCSVVTTVAPR